jgi:hypothetical protein
MEILLAVIGIALIAQTIIGFALYKEIKFFVSFIFHETLPIFESLKICDDCENEQD